MKYHFSFSSEGNRDLWKLARNWIKWKWDKAQGSSAESWEWNLVILCFAVCWGGFQSGLEGLCHPWQGVLWALQLSGILTADAFAVSASGSRQTHFVTGQWVFGSDNHLRVSGSDEHLEAVCARFGSQLESGYEVLCLLLQFLELDSFESYTWGLLDFPKVHQFRHASSSFSGRWYFPLVTKNCHFGELDSFHTSSSFLFPSY